MKPFDEKLHEFIKDITENNVVSNCCAAKIVLLDVCIDCKEHCTPLYEEMECECGGMINAIDLRCIDCNKIYKT